MTRTSWPAGFAPLPVGHPVPQIARRGTEDARLSVPTDEHFLPLLYVAALRRTGDEVAFFNDVIEGGSISMTGVRIG